MLTPAGRNEPPAARVAVAAAFASIFVLAVSSNTLPAVLLRAAPDVGMRAEMLALAASIQFAGFFLATLVGGVLCDRFGKKPVLQCACLLTAAGALVWTVAANIFVACAAAALLGMGIGILESMATALLADLYPLRRSLVLNLSQAAYCLGAAGGPALIAVFMPRGVSWRIFFAATAGLAGALFVLYRLALIPTTQSGERASPSRAETQAILFTLPGLAGAIFCYVLAETAVVVYANLHLRAHLAAPEAWAIRGISAVWLGMLAGRLLCAALPERLPGERVIAVLCAAAALALVAQAPVSDWRLGFALLTVTGFSFAGIWPLIVSLAAARHPTRTGTAVGFIVAAGSLGAIAAPLLVSGLLHGATGWRFFLLLALLLCATAVLTGWRRGKHRYNGVMA